MHELSICESLIEIALAAMKEQGVSRHAASLTVEIGRLTAVVPDSLRFYFGILSQGTPLQSAELRIKSVVLRTRCRSCLLETEPDFPTLACFQCGTPVEILSGRELRLVSIDVPEEIA
jgi:hydrogenase nickel incorporation protein HypA/HybF